MRSAKVFTSPVARNAGAQLLPACCLLLLLAGSGCTLPGPPPAEFESVSLGKDQWQFVGGEWEESGEGVMTPPRIAADEHLAFNTSRAYADFEAEFDFRWNIQNCGAGLIFRARDAQQYYMAHFPCTGQQYRAEHFWAALSKVDESGWVHFLQKELVSGAPSEIGIWHKVRLVVEGPEFRLWVNGRPQPVVRDDTYTGPGFVGLESFNARDPDTIGPYGDPIVNIGAGSSFRNVRIRGRKDDSVAWDPGPKPVRNHVYPLGDTPLGKWQYASSLGRAPNGDLIMKLAVAKEHLVPGAVQVLLRSTDNARSWSEPWKLPEALKNGSFHTGADGLLRLHWVQHEPPFRILTAASSDNGKTWGDIEERGRMKFAKGLEVGNAYVGKIVELKNGTLLRFGYAVGPNESVHGAIMEKGGVRYWGPITEADFGFSIRSTDGGEDLVGSGRRQRPQPQPPLLHGGQGDGFGGLGRRNPTGARRGPDSGLHLALDVGELVHRRRQELESGRPGPLPHVRGHQLHDLHRFRLPGDRRTPPGSGPAGEPRRRHDLADHPDRHALLRQRLLAGGGARRGALHLRREVFGSPSAGPAHPDHSGEGRADSSHPGLKGKIRRQAAPFPRVKPPV